MFTHTNAVVCILMCNTCIHYYVQALSPVGAMFGGLVAWPISDLLGRQAALMMSGVPALAGWLMIALAHLASSHVHAFYGVLLAGRTLTGFSSGWSVFCVSVSYYNTRMHEKPPCVVCTKSH